MKEHWELAEQPLRAEALVYCWTPPWPAHFCGFRASVPVVMKSIHIGLECVASNDVELCERYPECGVEPLCHDRTLWYASKIRLVALGSQVVVELAKPPLHPAAVEVFLVPVDQANWSRPEQSVVRIESKMVPENYTLPLPGAELRQAARAERRRRQVAQCLETLKAPYSPKRDR